MLEQRYQEARTYQQALLDASANERLAQLHRPARSATVGWAGRARIAVLEFWTHHAWHPHRPHLRPAHSAH